MCTRFLAVNLFLTCHPTLHEESRGKGFEASVRTADQRVRRYWSGAALHEKQLFERTVRE